MRRQHWRFLAYVYMYLSVGIAVAKDKKYSGFTKYQRSMRPLRIWQANRKYALRKSMALHIAQDTHTSSQEALECTIPYLLAAVKKKKTCADVLAEVFDLEEEEVAWLRKQS